MAPAGPIFCPQIFMVSDWSHGPLKATFTQDKKKKNHHIFLSQKVKQFRK